VAKEIERKFLLDELPLSLTCKKKEYIRQGYLAVSDTGKVRIRQKDDRFNQTVTRGLGKNREQFKVELTEKQFESFWPGTRHCQLEKTRLNYKWKDHTIYIDQFHGPLDGLFTAKIQFWDETTARAFKKPSFLADEISFDPRYKNHFLAELPAEQRKHIFASGINKSLIGSIPFIREGGEKKVILITKRKEKHWIFPKGQQENHMSFKQVALMEAEEEAGITGHISGTPIRIPYEKMEFTCNLLAYPLEVSRIFKKWDEDKERQRKIVTIKEAYRLSDRLSVHCGLQYLEQFC
jgi:adenylate cyclase